MKYRIEHTTEYQYETLVKMSHNQIMLSPQNSQRIVCHDHRINVFPAITSDQERVDFFGNQVYSFCIETGHRKLQVTAQSTVTVRERGIGEQSQSPSWESVKTGLDESSDPHWLSCAPFRFDSPRSPRRAAFADYASVAFPAGRPILEAALQLTRQIHQEFVYDTQATHVHTDVDRVFELKKGVCQDFTHFQVSALRSLGLAARYVSGYLRTVPPPGEAKLVGADQSHAWVALYCGPDLGWVDFDPTNAALCTLDHIPIALGRDYGDVTPFRGVFLGGGNHRLSVSVDVTPLGVSNHPVE